MSDELEEFAETISGAGGQSFPPFFCLAKYLFCHPVVVAVCVNGSPDRIRVRITHDFPDQLLLPAHGTAGGDGFGSKDRIEQWFGKTDAV